MNFEEMLDSLCKENPEYKETIERARLISEAYGKGFKAGRNKAWISVKDDLPDLGERVIVTDGVFSGEAYLNSNGKWIRYDNCSFDRDIEELFETKITHWMPMPIPPKKEKENE